MVPRWWEIVLGTNISCTISKNVHISSAVNFGNNFIHRNSETIGSSKKGVFTIAIDFSDLKRNFETDAKTRSSRDLDKVGWLET